VTGSSERFRHLGKAPGPGDLFEHYGVELGPAHEPESPAVVVEALACRRCGWFVPKEGAPACPLCGDAST